MEIELASTSSQKNVSRCSRAAGGVNAVCHTYAGGVVALGSDVMKQPKVVPIYWGNTVTGGSALKLAFDQFFAELLNSDYVDRLAQYNVAQPIVMASHSIAGASTNVTSSDVATQLTAWFKNNTIPEPNPLSDAPNWYYVILAPPGATVGSPGECGYHSSSTLTVNIGTGLIPINTTIDQAWGLVYFPPPAAGATPASVVNSVCYCLVHEMVEAFTNPRGQGWSVNVAASGGNAGQNCEIGDLCETKAFHNVGRWSVETYWSNQDKGCVGTFGPDWSSLVFPSGGLLGSPVAGHDLNGLVELFAVSRDGNLWHRPQQLPNAAWGPWQTVLAANPGIASSGLSVGYNQDGRIEVYAMQSGGILWHVWQTAVNGAWSGGGSLGAPAGGIIGGVSVANNKDGRLEIFGVGSDHQLHHVWQTAPNSGWSAWGSLGAPSSGPLPVGDPRVVRNADGRLEVFILGSDQKIWHIWQTAPNNGWSGWASLGGPAVPISNGAPFVGNNADGRIEVFTTGADGGIYHIWQTAPSNGWSAWGQLQAPLPGIQFNGLGAVANNKDGRFQLFFIGSDGALWTLSQSSPSNGWSAVRFLDAAPPAQAMNGDQIPASALDSAGRLSAFVAGQDGAVWQISQISAGGTWGSLVKD